MEETLEVQNAGIVPQGNLANANQDILSQIDDLQQELDWCRKNLLLGIDTQGTRVLREIIKDPIQSKIDIGEEATKWCLLSLLHELSKQKLSDVIHSIGFRVFGSRMDLWIFLNAERYNFESRAAIYRVFESVKSRPYFRKISTDLLIFSEGEAELPSNFVLAPPLP